MRSDVAASLTKSAESFRSLVWPRISDACGGGELVPVELVTEAEFSRSLDVLAGIDAWQIVTGTGMRGIASRVQLTDRLWNTFTIRYSLRSGAATEFHKRSWALQTNGLLPQLWAHAYTNPDSTELLAVCVVESRPLLELALGWHERHGEEPELWRVRDGMWVKDVTGGNRMLVIPWNLLPNRLYTWPALDEGRCRTCGAALGIGESGQCRDCTPGRLWRADEFDGLEF